MHKTYWQSIQAFSPSPQAISQAVRLREQRPSSWLQIVRASHVPETDKNEGSKKTLRDIFTVSNQ